MQLHDFIKAGEIEDLPDDDPHEAFAQFVRIAQARLSNRIEALSTSSDEQRAWQLTNDARHGFMNIVVAAARKFEVDPLASIEVPRSTDYDENAFRQFQSDLDFFVTQLVLENSARSRRDSVLVSAELKTKIGAYVHHLREIIQKADIHEDKRVALLAKLAAFEAELEKRRLNMMAVTMVAIALASAPGGIWSTGEAAQKLIGNIFKVIGEAKQADDEARKRLTPIAPQRAIAPPRSEQKPPQKPRRASGGADMDDDIPF
jgi:hypothetical protein